eukprot:247799-Prorocentrum_minimum.AAC.2
MIASLHYESTQNPRLNLNDTRTISTEHVRCRRLVRRRMPTLADMVNADGCGRRCTAGGRVSHGPTFEPPPLARRLAAALTREWLGLPEDRGLWVCKEASCRGARVHPLRHARLLGRDTLTLSTRTRCRIDR